MTCITSSQFKKLGKNPKGAAIAHLLEQQHNEPAKEQKPKPARSEARQLKQMKMWLSAAGIPFESEYRFDKKRRFRADIAIPHLRLLIEYDGLISRKSRHTTITGFSKDCEKLNLAATLNWKVLRYTVLNHGHLLTDVQKIINQQTPEKP